MGACAYHRFEAEAGERFWEILISERTFITRHGRVGTEGRATASKVFDGPDEMRREAERRIFTTTTKGYLPVSIPTAAERLDDELVRAVLDRPEDDGPWSRLCSPNTPRAQWAAGQARTPEEAQLAAPSPDELHLLKAHGSLLLPSQVTALWRKKPRRGHEHTRSADTGSTRLAWRAGYLWAAHLGRESERPPITVRQLVTELLTHPSARFLHRLIIGALGPPDEYDYREVVQALVQCGSDSLRELHLAEFTPEQCAVGFSHLGELTELGPALPRLRTLVLRGGHMGLEGLRFPKLQRLQVIGIDAASLAHLAQAPWSALTHLHLDALQTKLSAESLAQLLRAAPGLRSLRLLRTVETQPLFEAIAAHAALHPLDEVDLTGGDLQALASVELTGVAQLHVGGNCLPPDAVAALEALGTHVVDGFQRETHAGQSTVTLARLQEFAPDSRSMAAAQKILGDDHWPSRGRDGDLIWGRCQGGELYDVFVNAQNLDAGCTCPSPKYPCKHAVALLTMAAQDFSFAPLPPPEGLVERTYST